MIFRPEEPGTEEGMKNFELSSRVELVRCVACSGTGLERSRVQKSKEWMQVGKLFERQCPLCRGSGHGLVKK